MDISVQRIEGIYYKTLDMIDNWSFKKTLVVLIAIWAVIYIPAALSLSVGRNDIHYAFYPEGAAPEGISYKDYDVRTLPIGLENVSRDRYVLDVESGETVTFNWTALNYDSDKHIGVIDVHYEMNGEEGEVRLSEVYHTPRVKSWEGKHTFEESGEVEYYYSVEKNDIPMFARRASVILEGGNLYEDVRTDPPPLINVFFIPASLVDVPVSLGGIYLSFTFYFALFVLLDAVILMGTFFEYGKGKAFLMTLLFVANPVTIFNIHQDEAIVAFTFLLPFYFLVKNRDKLSAVLAGLSVPTKIWGGFLFPLYLIKKQKSVGKRIMLLIIAVGTSAVSLLSFYLFWGSRALFFLGYYSGAASKVDLGPVSFWTRWAYLLNISESSVPTTAVVVLIAGLSLLLFMWAWKKEWVPLITLTVLLSVFFALYTKIHWDYYLIFMPFLAYWAVNDRRFTYLFFTITAVLYGMMVLSPLTGILQLWAMAVMSTLVSVLLLYQVYLFLTDEGLRETEVSGIWER